MIRIINKYFWKTGMGPISIFLYNFIFIGTLAFLYKKNGIVSIPSLLTLPIITISISFMPMLIIDLKRTTFVQKYFLINSKRKNIFLPLMFFVPIILIAYIFFILIVLIINYDQIDIVFGNINWFELMFALFLTITLSLFIGQTIYAYFKNLFLAQGITMILTLWITLFSGMLIPITTLNEISFFKYVSYLNPFKFTNNLIINSWFSDKNPINLNGSGIFNFQDNFDSITLELKNKTFIKNTITLFTKTDKILNLLMPPIYIFFFLLLNINKDMSLQFVKKRRKFYEINRIKKNK